MTFALREFPTLTRCEQSRRDDAAVVRVTEKNPGHPLGPIVERRLGSLHARSAGLLVAGGALFVLGMARWIEPDPAGLGSHSQLGLAPCFMPVIVGVPCPTCGMTTAFAHAVRLEPVDAFAAQPMGLLLAALTFALALGGIDLLVTGRYWTLNWYRVSPVRLVVLFAGTMLITWLGKIVVGLLNGSYPMGG